MKKFKVEAGINNILPGRIFKMKDNLSTVYSVVYDKVIGRSETMTSYLYYIIFDFELIKSGPDCIWRSLPDNEGFILSEKEFKKIIKNSNILKNKNTNQCDLNYKNLHYVEKTITKKTENGTKTFEILVYPYLKKDEYPSIYDDIKNKIKLKETK